MTSQRIGLAFLILILVPLARVRAAPDGHAPANLSRTAAGFSGWRCPGDFAPIVFTGDRSRYHRDPAPFTPPHPAAKPVPEVFLFFRLFRIDFTGKQTPTRNDDVFRSFFREQEPDPGIEIEMA